MILGVVLNDEISHLAQHIRQPLIAVVLRPVDLCLFLFLDVFDHNDNSLFLAADLSVDVALLAEGRGEEWKLSAEGDPD